MGQIDRFERTCAALPCTKSNVLCRSWAALSTLRPDLNIYVYFGIQIHLCTYIFKSGRRVDKAAQERQNALDFVHFGIQINLCTHMEGTGTRPDYLVNRVLTKNKGPHPKKIVRKSRNSCTVNSGGVRAQEKLTQSPNRASPETNANAQRILFVSGLLRSPWHPLAPN